MQDRAFLPFDVAFPASGAEVIGAWIDRQSFTEPFLIETLTGPLRVAVEDHDPLGTTALVRRLSGAPSEARVATIALNRFIDLHQAEPPADPILIFHMGRAGSTLLSQMLSTIPTMFVLSEPPIINRILDPSAPFSSAASRRAALHAALRALCQCQPHGTMRIAFKFRSWNILFAKDLLAAFGLTRVCFLHRNAVEVWASMRGSPPGWLRSQALDPLVASSGLAPGAASGLSACQFAAHMLFAFCAAAKSLDLDDAAYVDHRDVIARFPGLVASVFDLSLTPEDLTRAAHRSLSHSKAIAGQRAYSADGAAKRLEVPIPEAELLREIVEPARCALSSPSRPQVCGETLLSAGRER